MKAWVFVYEEADGSPRIVHDDFNRIVGSCEMRVALTFAGQLNARGIPAVAVGRTPAQVNDALIANGVEPEACPDHFVLIEAQATDIDDATRWALELADRIVGAPR